MSDRCNIKFVPEGSCVALVVPIVLPNSCIWSGVWSF